MEKPNHTLSDLFKQLGLPEDHDAIERFIASHRPLPQSTRLAEAPFWNDAQRRFLEQEINEDADWAERVDELNERLH